MSASPDRPPRLLLRLPAWVDRLDADVDRRWDRVRAPWTDRFFYACSEAANFSVLWYVLTAASAPFLDQPGWRILRTAGALILESVLVNVAIKSLFRRPRPVVHEPRPHRLRTPVTSSFPSGHASAAMVAACLLTDRVDVSPFPWSMGAAWVSGVWVLAVAVAVSRLHVRIHHAGDVLGGAAIGLFVGLLVRVLLPLP